MEITTTRIDLGGGDWAEAYGQVKRVTMRLHEQEIQKHFRPLDDEPLLLSDLTEKRKGWPEDFVVNAAAVDNGRIAELYMLHQVKAWSFGPVDQETIDGMTRDKFEELRKALDGLYEPNPLAAGGEGG